MASKQKICTFLWFDGEGAPRPRGTAMVVDFQLAGQRFQALNGGPQFEFTEAISLMVDCESQAEVDRLGERLTSGGGQESMCGWCKDRWGLSCQVIPSAAVGLMMDPDAARAGRVMAALMQMRKIDLAALQRAHAGA